MRPRAPTTASVGPLKAWGVAAALLLGGGLGPGPAAARPRHEYVSPRFLAQHDAAAARAAPALSGAGALPDALPRPEGALPPPAPGGPRPPVFGAPGGLEVPDEARPDRRTEVDAPLRYTAVFNPTVVPLRRNVAFDRIDADLRLSVGPAPWRPVPIGPRQLTPGFEAFWGDATVEVSGGGARLPSVAPDMRILALEAAAPVQVFQDGADNFHLKVAAHEGPLRVRFLVEAPPSYFAHPLPDHVPLAAGRGDPATALPEALRQRAAGVLARLGVDPDQPFSVGVARLVAWFRAFEAGPPPPPAGDLYAELALGQVGVCRHRAFAFFVTARAAGVPTRYVQNEAHAFIEIRAPDGPWLRVDLGGEAPQLDLQGGPDLSLHDPPDDGLPRPPEYLAQAGARLGPEAPPPPAAGGPAAGGAREGAGPGAGAGVAAGVAPPVPLPVFAAEGSPEAAEAAGQGAAVRLALDPQAPAEVFRGDPLPGPIGGRLSSQDGAPVAGRRVQLYLVPAGGGPPVPVGAPVRSGPDGRFTQRLRIPGTLGPGAYRLVAASEAGGGFGPGRSDP